MLTLKNLNERIEKLEKEQCYKIPDTKFIARVKIYQSDNNYKDTVENLKKREFKLISTGTETIFLTYETYEIWEKEYAQGEF